MAQRAPFRARGSKVACSQHTEALRWLEKNRKLWEGKEIRRGDPGQVSPAWRFIVAGLKEAGIYSKRTYVWDLRVDNLVRDFELLERHRAQVDAGFLSNDLRWRIADKYEPIF